MVEKFAYLVLNSDREMLRIRLKAKISKILFGESRKTLYLGLKNTPENFKKGETIALIIENDIRANKLNKDLSFYLPGNELVRNIGLAYDPNAAKISLSELYEAYKEFRKPTLAKSTYRDRYQKLFTPRINHAPQNLHNQIDIVDFLSKDLGAENFGRLCLVLYNAIEWGKRRGKLPENFVNKVKIIRNDYNTTPGVRKLPKEILKIDKYFHDYKYKGFSREEAERIIKAYEEWSTAEYRKAYNDKIFKNSNQFLESRKLIASYVKLKFWTGCRGEEASALKWNDISEDFEYIYFRYAYDFIGKERIRLKTEGIGREGTMSRKFPCGKKLKLLLKKLHKSKGKSDYLFVKSNGVVITNCYIKISWLGDKDTRLGIFMPGVVYNLVKKKEVAQYLTPNSTRHTWINLQLQAGVPITNVAKLAGNSPKTILKNYASVISDIPLAPEI